MTPSEIFQNLPPGSPLQREAWEELTRMLQREAAHPLTARDGESYLIPEDCREDVIGDVQYALLKRAIAGKLDVHTRGDGACIGYVRTSLVNRHISIGRRERRFERGAEDHPGNPFDAVPAPRVTGEVPAPDAEKPPDADAEVARIRKLLGRVFGTVREGRQPRYRAALDTAWRQLQDLVFERMSMENVLERDEGLGQEAPAELRKQALDRMYKSHERLRVALQLAAEHLGAAGTLSRADAHLAADAIRLLLCRTSGGGHVVRPSR